MSNEFIAILSIGIALAGLQLHNHHYQRADIQTLREETHAEFKVQRADIQALREETQAEFRVQRADIQALREETQAEFKVQREVTNDLLSRMVRLEALFEDRRVAAGNLKPR